MTHKICISLDDESWDILQRYLIAHRRSHAWSSGRMAMDATASAVVRAALDALADDCLGLHRVDRVMARRWT